MSKKHQSYNFEFSEVILFLFRNWKRLLITGVSAGLIGLIASGPWLITPKFRSVCIFYPGTTNSISSALFYSNNQKTRDPLMFADQEVTEQYLQMLQSDDLGGRIIQKYKLYEHYQLDPNKLEDQKKMGKIYQENILFNRTDFNSIKVSVLDPSPEKAAEMANGIVELLDQMKHEVHHKVAKQIYDIVEKEYLSKLQFTDSIRNRLKELGALGVYDFGNQSKGISEAQGSGHGGAGLDKERASLTEHGGEAFMLLTLLELETENLSILRTKYEQARVDLNAELSNVFVISNATIANFKAYPRRTIISVISALAGFVMGCVFLIGAEKIREFRQKIQL